MAIKKTATEILDILTRMKNGEDVVEQYNSEKTARAVTNKLIEYIQDVDSTMHLILCILSREGEEYAKEYYDYYDLKQYFDGLPFEQARPVMEQLKQLDLIGKAMKRDRTAVKDLQHDSSDSAQRFGAHDGFLFVKRKSRAPLSGKFIAKCNVQTNTAKKRTSELYQQAIGDAMRTIGLYSTFYLPSFCTIYSTQPTEWMYDEAIKKIRANLNEPMPQATPKQIEWIQKKTGLDGSSLNKYQASELLDILFNGEENRGAEDPDKVIQHYTNILKNKNESMNRKIKNIIKETINRLLSEKRR